MPGFGFAPGGSKYDVTPLENMFIEMYLPDTSGEFLKVYLYGLMLCYRGDIADMDCRELAKVLRVNEDTVRAALAYWQELGLIRVRSFEPLEVQYINLKDRFIQSAAPQAPRRDEACEALRGQLQGMFAGKRALAPAELSMACQWLKELQFEVDLVVLLAQYCMQRGGDRVSFAYMDKVARDWAKRGIRTFEAGDKHIRAQDLAASGAAQVLRSLSVHSRLPTAREEELYRKWTQQWGFDPKAVLAACAHTSATLNPSFQYLDGILSRLHAQGSTSARDVAGDEGARKAQRRQRGELLQALGVPGGAAMPAEAAALVARARKDGFSQASLLQGAQLLARRGASRPADLQALLEDWLARGITDDAAVQRECALQAQADVAVQGWLKHWGLQRAPASREIAAYLRYTQQQGIPGDVVDYAAQCAGNAERPLSYMAALLKGWKQAGITSVAQAAARQSAPPAGKPPEAGFSLQRDDEYYRRVASDFDGMAGET